MKFEQDKRGAIGALVAGENAPVSKPVIEESVLTEFLVRTATAGERSVAVLRGAFCFLGLVNMLIVAGGYAEVMQGSIKHAIMMGAMSAGIGSAAIFWGLLRKEQASPQILYVSVILDIFIATLVMLCIVIWPAKIYYGLLGMPHGAAFAIILATSGLRLSKRAIQISAVGNFVAVTGLVGLDIYLHPDVLGRADDDYGAVVMFLVVALMMAIAMEYRSRELVLRGASAAVTAERARQRLGIYVSQPVAEAALSTQELKVGGELRQAVILFSDLRGFTQYGRHLPPERLIRELNSYLEAMITEIRAEGGVVDKYIGDAIMVVFGMPTTQVDDGVRAIRTAIRMQLALIAHNEIRAQEGLPALKQGIGIHCGPVVAGNIGTLERMQYTVVGDVVNTASRLEGLTKELGVLLLVSAEVMESVKTTFSADLFVATEPLSVRGRDTQVSAYALRNNLSVEQLKAAL